MGPVPRRARVLGSGTVAHVYCGHLGTPNGDWWPNRSRLAPEVDEFEAECAAFLALRRLDDRAELPPYLHQHLTREGTIPDINVNRVLIVAHLLEEMQSRPLPARD